MRHRSVFDEGLLLIWFSVALGILAFIVPVLGNYGADYLRRAAMYNTGFGANLAEDAAYPSMFAQAGGTSFDSGKR